MLCEKLHDECRAVLLAAASSAVARKITCNYCSCWNVWRAVKRELVGRRCGSGVSGMGPHQCRAAGVLGGEVMPGRDEMPATLLDGSDCAATMTRSSRAEHLDAPANSRQGLRRQQSTKVMP